MRQACGLHSAAGADDVTATAATTAAAGTTRRAAGCATGTATTATTASAAASRPRAAIRNDGRDRLAADRLEAGRQGRLDVIGRVVDRIGDSQSPLQGGLSRVAGAARCALLQRQHGTAKALTDIGRLARHHRSKLHESSRERRIVFHGIGDRLDNILPRIQRVVHNRARRRLLRRRHAPLSESRIRQGREPQTYGQRQGRHDDRYLPHRTSPIVSMALNGRKAYTFLRRIKATVKDKLYCFHQICDGFARALNRYHAMVTKG